MRRHGLASAVILLLGVNVFVLSGVAYNRSGEPDALVQLTERELYPLFWDEARQEENTGISLALKWNRHAGMLRDVGSSQNTWFDQSKLEAVGFDCSVPAHSGHAEQYYGKALPRRTYAVLEFEGRSWREFAENEREKLTALEEKARDGKFSQQELASAKTQYDIKVTKGSRLFVVDVGNDPAELRSRYPDRHRHIITPASVRLQLITPQMATSKRGGARLEGYVNQILIDYLHVPRELHPPLEEAMKQRQYSVTLRYGKRYEPWITDIRPALGAKGKATSLGK